MHRSPKALQLFSSCLPTLEGYVLSDRGLLQSEIRYVEPGRVGVSCRREQMMESLCTAYDEVDYTMSFLQGALLSDRHGQRAFLLGEIGTPLYCTAFLARKRGRQIPQLCPLANEKRYADESVRVLAFACGSFRDSGECKGRNKRPPM
jgi:hypothetical protein